MNLKSCLIILLCLCYSTLSAQQKATVTKTEINILNLTPEAFGCMGDSIQDDTENLQRAIDYCKTNQLTLRSSKGKVYAISKPLDFTNPGEMQVDFGGAEIRAIAPMEYMIKYDNEKDFSTSHNNIINNLVLDCRDMAGGIYCPTAIKTSFNFIMIRNCSKKAFAVKHGYEVFFTNSHIHCNTAKETYGIYMETGDSHFDNIAIIDAHTAVYQKTSGVNFYDKIHAWLYNNVEGSTFFDVSGLALLNQCYCDTAEKGYHINGFAILKIVNSQYYNNPDCYDSTQNPTIFSFASEDLSRKASITCSNSDFNSGGLNARLCNFEKQRIQFDQCFIDPSITGYLGQFYPTAAEGISFSRAVGTPKDNNNFLRLEKDQSNQLYIDAQVEADNKLNELVLGTIPDAYLPSREVYGLAVLVWKDGSSSQGNLKITLEGQIKIAKGKKKGLERVVLDINYY